MKGFFRQVLSTLIGTLIGTFCSIIVGLILVALILKGLSYKAQDVIEKHSVLHVLLRGEIVERRRPMDFDFLRGELRGREPIGLYELVKAIELAKKDDRIDGIFLDMHGFGAGWASLTTLKHKLDEFKATGKFIYTYAARMGEPEIYLASSATRTFMEPSGDYELKGLGLTEVFLKGLLQKLELEPKIFRVGRFKSAVEVFTNDQMSPENREQSKALLRDVWSEVSQSIVKGYNISGTQLDSMAREVRVSNAKAAKSEGMIYGLEFQDQVIERIRLQTVGEKEDPRFVDPTQLVADRRGKKTKHAAQKIAILFAEGEIVSADGDVRSIDAEDIVEDIRNAREDDEIMALVLRVNSPGGDALASDIIWRELDLTRNDIPVVVSMGDVAASGGYYIAAGGNYIFAEPTTITGSIGVFGVLFNVEKLMRHKVGLSFDRVTTHPYSDFASAVRPMSARESEVIQQEVERVYRRFLEVVADARGFKDINQLSTIAEGRVWSGVQAKEIGLVDELGGLEAAVKKAAELAEVSEYDLQILPEPKDPLKEILEKFRSSGSEALVGTALSRLAADYFIPKKLVTSKSIEMINPQSFFNSPIQARLPSLVSIQ